MSALTTLLPIKSLNIVSGGLTLLRTALTHLHLVPVNRINPFTSLLISRRQFSCSARFSSILCVNSAYHYSLSKVSISVFVLQCYHKKRTPLRSESPADVLHHSDKSQMLNVDIVIRLGEKDIISTALNITGKPIILLY